jgi:hypothetical protein
MPGSGRCAAGSTELLARVRAEEIPESGPLQRLGASVLRTAVFAFEAYAFVGPVWQVWFVLAIGT